MDKKAYRAKELANELGIGVSSVWLYVRQGKLKSHKISDKVTLFYKEDIEVFLKGGAR